MWRTMLSCFLVLTMVGLDRAVLAAQQGPGAASALRKQLALIPTGAVVEVKLQQKGSEKITGKLGQVTGEGFEVQTVKSGKVVSEKVAFADVKSVKEIKAGKGRRTALWVLVGIGVAVGVVILVVEAGRSS